MICLNHDRIYSGRQLSLQRFYDVLETYYTGFVPFGRPNHLIAIANQSKEHMQLMERFLSWLCDHDRDPKLKPERPAEDDEL